MEEGGDDTTECVALRSAIIRRVEFLANAMAEEDMNLEETYSSWHAVCVLPALEGYESDEFDDESEGESTGPSISKKQKISNAKKMAALKTDNEALKKNNKEKTREYKKLKKDHDKVAAKNLALGRDLVAFKSLKAMDISNLKDAQRRTITMLKNDQKDAINEVKKEKDAEKETALSTQKRSKSVSLFVPSEYFN